jgi:hypothetical protein
MPEHQVAVAAQDAANTSTAGALTLAGTARRIMINMPGLPAATRIGCAAYRAAPILRREQVRHGRAVQVLDPLGSVV